METDLAVRARANELTLLAFLAMTVMLFAAFTAAYLIRRTGTDWQHVSLPGILWLNTAVLAASSVTVELARRSAKPSWLAATTVLGIAFLAGQLLAWRTLAQEGIFLPTNPHSSFFYMLTAVHGMHLLGGIGALMYATAYRNALGLGATYWHFVDGVWLYVFLMLSVF